MLSKLVIQEGPGAPAEYLLDVPRVVVGRQVGVDICLNTKDVSRAHACLNCEDQRWYLEDLHSSNGTWLNGAPVKGKMPLHDKDQIAIGSYLLVFESASALPERDVTIHAEFPVGPANRQLFEHDPATKLQFILDLARDLGRNLNLDELLPLLLDRLLVLFPHADRGLVLLKSGDNLTVRARRGRGPYADVEKGYSRSVVERVLEEGVGILATEQEQGDTTTTIQSLGIRSFMCVPLQAKDQRPLGVLQFDCFRPGHEFTQEDLNILTAISVQFTMILENAFLHSELLQQERIKRDLDLARLSKMVAGVAHEINNPLAFVANNTTIVRRDLDDLRQLLALYQQADAVIAGGQPDLHQQIQQTIDDMDLAFTLENLDELLSRSSGGLERIQKIVEALRNFARLEQSEFDLVDLNIGIESTLNTMQELFRERQVILQMELGQLPEIDCSPSRINQVVFNLVHNALDACSPGNRVTVKTAAAADAVEIHVIDTGAGIAPEIRDKIFDPFFTTKPLGKGVGLGLSLSYGVIQEHHGSIEVESQLGQGSHFIVRLPCRNKEPRT